MQISCSAPGCTNSVRKGKGAGAGTTFRMWSFPRDPKRRQKWLRVIGCPDQELRPGARICEAHFPNDQWKTSSRLREDAVPSSSPLFACICREDTVRRPPHDHHYALQACELCRVHGSTTAVALQKSLNENRALQERVSHQQKQQTAHSSVLPNVLRKGDHIAEKEAEIGTFCSLKACRNYEARGKESSTKARSHEFPKDKETCQCWVKFVNKHNRSSNFKTPATRSSAFICSDHFEAWCFTPTGQLKKYSKPTIASEFTAERALKNGLIPYLHSPLLHSVNDFDLSVEDYLKEVQATMDEMAQSSKEVKEIMRKWVLKRT